MARTVYNGISPHIYTFFTAAGTVSWIENLTTRWAKALQHDLPRILPADQIDLDQPHPLLHHSRPCSIFHDRLLLASYW